MDVASYITAHGGVVHRHELISAGFTGYAIGRARHAGEIARVRRAWYRAQHVSGPVVSAVRVEGALSCTSLLRESGVWLPPDSRVHVAVSMNAARLRPIAEDAVVHWRSRAGEITRSRDSVAAALAHATMCLPPEFALVAIDSALNSGVVSRTDLHNEFTSALSKRLLRSSDPTSQSGLETLARYRLRSHHVRVRTQVPIDRVGRVDVVIGDRLVLELDGRRFHDSDASFDEDRRRDLELHRRGYQVIRLSYSQVMNEWPLAESVILDLVRRRAHRWPRRRA